MIACLPRHAMISAAAPMPVVRISPPPASSAAQVPAHAVVQAGPVEVSEAARDYLEGRFGLRAPERTTEEFLAAINENLQKAMA